MQIHVLFDTKGRVQAVFHPSSEAGAPQLTFRPGRGQRAGVFEVPVELERLAPHELHGAITIKIEKKGALLKSRKR